MDHTMGLLLIGAGVALAGWVLGYVMGHSAAWMDRDDDHG